MLSFEIFNYKTIKHIPKTDIDGYGSIQGNNHIGKSAIIQAVRAVFANPKGNDFIRDGEDFCEVRLWHNGNQFIWIKPRDESASYYVNGSVEPYTKVTAGSIPKEMSDLGYGPMLIGSEKVELYYAAQFEPLFLMDKANTNFATDLLSAVYNIDVAYKAMQLAKNVAKSEADKCKIRKADEKAAELALKPFDSLDVAASHFESVQASHEALEVLKADLDSLSSLSATLSTLARKARVLIASKTIAIPDSSTLDALQEVQALSSLSNRLQALEKTLGAVRTAGKILIPAQDLSSALNALELLSELHTDLQEHSTRQEVLAAVSDINLPDYSKLQEDSMGLEGASLLASKVTALARKARALSRGLTGVPSLGEVPSLGDVTHLKALLSTMNEKEAIMAAVSRLPALPEAPVLDTNLKEYKELLKRVRTLGNELRRSREELAGVESELAPVLEELSTYKNCPLCGADMEGASICH